MGEIIRCRYKFCNNTKLDSDKAYKDMFCDKTCHKYYEMYDYSNPKYRVCDECGGKMIDEEVYYKYKSVYLRNRKNETGVIFCSQQCLDIATERQEKSKDVSCIRCKKEIKPIIVERSQESIDKFDSTDIFDTFDTMPFIYKGPCCSTQCWLEEFDLLNEEMFQCKLCTKPFFNIDIREGGYCSNVHKKMIEMPHLYDPTHTTKESKKTRIKNKLLKRFKPEVNIYRNNLSIETYK